MATLNGRLEKKIVEWKLIYEHDDKGVRVLGTRESSGDCLREDGASLRIEISSKEMTRFSTVKHAFVHGDRVYAVRVNESTFIPLKTRHRLKNPGTEPLVMIEVQCGDYVGEDDIVRFDDQYGRVKA